MNPLDFMGPPLSRAGSVTEQLAPQPGKLQSMLSDPFILNILAQQGHSLTPGPSPLGVIGRAGLAAQQQEQQQQMSRLQKLLIQSQIGVNQAKALGAGDPQTAAAKIRADVAAGRITAAQGQKLLDAELRKGTTSLQADTNSLRGQFRTDIAGPRASLQGLANAESLLSNPNNAISDTAAFTSFIRSIDNSVVRPAEQEAYNKALGLRNQIEATVQQWAGKGPLPPETRRQLIQSIKTLRETMEGIYERTVDYYGKEAKKFGLDPESVTGIPVRFDNQQPWMPDGGGDVPQVIDFNDLPD